MSDAAQRSFWNHIHNMHISAQQAPGSPWKAECWQWDTEPNAIPSCRKQEVCEQPRREAEKDSAFPCDTISATSCIQ